MLLKLFYIFIVVIALKVIYNLRNYIWIKIYFFRYRTYIKEQQGWYIQKNRQKIIELFKKANLRDNIFPHVEPVGFGYVSLYENICFFREDIITLMFKYFNEAEGVFKQRIFESFSPFYWVESILNLPKIILEYLGVKPENLIIKIFQIIWWLIMFVSTIVYYLMKTLLVGWKI